jgi:LytS/YehU family sensor histidine kinase
MDIVPAALLGLVVYRLSRRFPWPRPFRAMFVLLQVLFAVGYAATWLFSISVVQSLMQHRLVLAFGPPGATPFLILGVWLYVMVAGVSYSTEATDRAAHAEAAAAKAQLAALRSQLHPHFLFNALHTVVQLIPREPARAAEAAEQIAQLLRTVVEEDRDVISVDHEYAFVQRYLDIERIRFGDRLEVRTSIADAARAATLPSFSLQTLVENAVQHGAGPRVEPTTVEISASVDTANLIVVVSDNGNGGPESGANNDAKKPGTGLARLRERLSVLYGTAASLAIVSGNARGFTATLTIPLTSNSNGDGD